ncbi:MAG: hypothetical protein GXO79_08370 [Chlorobi bacterium]|nr:hypothetical protein [Chlorobiota bacterium]
MKLKTFLFITILFISNIVFAQNDTIDNVLKIDLSADLFSRYIWRGNQFGGSSPSIQPSIIVSYKNLEIGTWGAYSLGGINPIQELDLYLSFNFMNDMFSTIFTDYYFPIENNNYNYFEYNKDKTGHIFESGLSFNGTDKIPVSFSAYLNFYGNDAVKLESNNLVANFNQKTGIQYSNYFELRYNKSSRAVDLNLFMGFTLTNQKKANITTGFIGETGFYSNSAGIVNLGITASKTLNISNTFNLPITTSIITNPKAQKVFLIFGISF